MDRSDLILTPEEMVDAFIKWQKTLPKELPEITQAMRFEVIAKAQAIHLLDELVKPCSNVKHKSVLGDKRKDCRDCLTEIRKNLESK